MRRWLARAPVVMLAGLGAIVTLTGGIWYLRSYLYTGNPVWPFLPGLFGHGPIWSAADYEAQFADLAAKGVGRSLRGLLTLPWHLASAQEMSSDPLEVHPLLWLGLAAAALRPRGEVRAWRSAVAPLAIVSSLYLLGWYLSYNHVRYLAPALPILTVLAAPGLARLGDRLDRRGRGAGATQRRGAQAALLLLTLGSAEVLLALHLVDLGAPPTTDSDRDGFLAGHLPAYRAVRRAAALPGRTYGLLTEDLVLYGDGKMIGDVFGEARYADVLPLLDRPEQLDRQLVRLGARYLLVNRRRLGRGFTPGPLLRTVYEDSGAALYERRGAGR